MNEIKALVKEAWLNQRGKFLGTLLGLALGICILAVGFFKTVFVLICGIIGLFVGKKLDEQESFFDFFEKIIPPGFRR